MPMIVVGTRGAGRLAQVSKWGAVQLADGTPSLDWWVAAEDRWHDPSLEPTVRQIRPSGLPMVETLVRVPGGDVAHRVYAVADGGGLVVIEIENRSPRSLAVAVSRRDVLTSRPPAAVPIQGIELPSESIVLPIAHGTSIRLGLGLGRGTLPPVPSWDAVQSGWLAQLDRCPRLDVPSSTVLDEIRELRSLLLMDEGVDADSAVDVCLMAGELVRLGERAEPWVDQVSEAAIHVAKASRRRSATVDEHAALGRAAEVLRAAGQPTGADDIDEMRRRMIGLTTGASSGVRRLAQLVDGQVHVDATGTVVLWSSGVPTDWFGQSFGVVDVPVPGGEFGVAVRWHGERPALIWEGPPGIAVRCPGLDPSWSSSLPRGEALLGTPVAIPLRM